jgi:hypothetical protein
MPLGNTSTMTAVSPMDCNMMTTLADGETASVSDNLTGSSRSSSHHTGRERFRKGAVLVENALLATRHGRLSGPRLASGRRSRGSIAGTHVAGSKSFAALGHAVVGFTRRGRGGVGHFTDAASNKSGARQNVSMKQAAAADDHPLHSASGVHGTGGDTVLVLTDEDSTRSINTTLIYEIAKPFFICMKIVGIFFIRGTQASSDINIVDMEQTTGATSGGKCHRLRSMLQTMANGFWSPAQLLGVVITILLTANFARSLYSLKVSYCIQTNLKDRFSYCSVCQLQLIAYGLKDVKGRLVNV